jgi:hypothetical protein
MYVKVKEDGSTVYPYTLKDFRGENRSTSFPADIPEEMLNAHGVYLVDMGTIPDYDRMLYRHASSLVRISSTRWKLEHKIHKVEDEHASSRVLKKRNDMLAETDWCALSDVTMSDEMRSYRQALRDITKQDGFPFSVVWPEKPE